jgi:hypothetical protein
MNKQAGKMIHTTAKNVAIVVAEMAQSVKINGNHRIPCTVAHM